MRVKCDIILSSKTNPKVSLRESGVNIYLCGSRAGLVPGRCRAYPSCHPGSVGVLRYRSDITSLLH